MIGLVAGGASNHQPRLSYQKLIVAATPHMKIRVDAWQQHGDDQDVPAAGSQNYNMLFASHL
jgi:hypothetical protein